LRFWYPIVGAFVYFPSNDYIYKLNKKTPIIMPNLNCKFAGLQLKSPIIAGSSALSNNIKNIIELEKQGVGAVVLKSLFEEEILGEHNKIIQGASGGYKADIENLDYLDYRIKDDTLTDYTKLISKAKTVTKLPIIGSINCVSPGEWIHFARSIEQAGADALEINLFIPASSGESEKDIEEKHIKVVQEAIQNTQLPVIVKISRYFADLGGIIKRLSVSGISGLVLFNRFYMPDIDIETEKIVSENIFSEPSDMRESLRWMALSANRAECDLAASTGVHNARGAIKQILAGASAVQIVSALYKHGAIAVKHINEGLLYYMKEKGYETIDDFKGKLSYGKDSDAALFERVQFMKYFSNEQNEKHLY
jgi:dihydroorotate dehydrogenase (fumarate)